MKVSSGMQRETVFGIVSERQGRLIVRKGYYSVRSEAPDSFNRGARKRKGVSKLIDIKGVFSGRVSSKTCRSVGKSLDGDRPELRSTRMTKEFGAGWARNDLHGIAVLGLRPAAKMLSNRRTSILSRPPEARTIGWGGPDPRPSRKPSPADRVRKRRRVSQELFFLRCRCCRAIRACSQWCGLPRRWLLMRARRSSSTMSFNSLGIIASPFSHED